jgi:alpha-1,3-mannosyltransferase
MKKLSADNCCREGRSAVATEYDGRLLSQGMKTRTILGVPIIAATAPQTVEMLDLQFERGGPARVAFANANALNIAYRNNRFRSILQNSIVINDGIGVDIASRLLFGAAFPQNLNGTDFTPHYLQSTRHRFRIFLLGSRLGVAERAGEYFARRCPQHVVVGCHHGHFTNDQTNEIISIIKATNADVILVAMGNPAQELWLADNLQATGCRLGFAVGALFDFVTGQSRRAPAWVRSARLEWVHRLSREPKRLWRRYLVGNPVFLLRVLGQWISGDPASLVEINSP